MRRVRWGLVVLALSVCALQPAAAWGGETEAAIKAINHARAGAGLAPLAASPALTRSSAAFGGVGTTGTPSGTRSSPAIRMPAAITASTASSATAAASRRWRRRWPGVPGRRGGDAEGSVRTRPSQAHGPRRPPGARR